MRKKKVSGEKGSAMIIEAAFVFPIVFVVVLLMIMAGEATYQKMYAERLVSTTVIEATARCADPALEHVQKTGGLATDIDDIKNAPYRYILTGDINKIGNNVQDELEDKMKQMKPLMFPQMKPEKVDIKVETKAGILISNLSVSCSFEVPFPLRIPMTDQHLKSVCRLYESRQIGDPAEFMRNVSFVVDYLERSANIEEYTAKVDNALKKVAQFMN